MAGARYVGTGWKDNGKTYTQTGPDGVIAYRTMLQQCQDDYLREGHNPNGILNACVSGTCNWKPAIQQGQGSGQGQQQGQGSGQGSGQGQRQVQQPATPQQIDPKIKQTCNAYADSVVQHYNYFKGNCPSGNYGFPVDRAKYYGECEAGMFLFKKKFDPQANDYRKQVAANCARKSPFFQPTTRGPAPSSAGAQSIAAVAIAGLCIDVDKGRVAAGTKIQLWNCTGKAPQKFVLESGSGRIRYAGSNFCVEQVPGGRPLVLTPCNQTFNRWTFDGGSSRIVGAGAAAGKCWDVPGRRFNPLQYVGIWPCHNGREQQFQLQ